MIHKLLVANRGEIARRVFATCRRLGIGTVAVHTPADAAMPFVTEADSAVLLDWVHPDTGYLGYLRGEEIIQSARMAGADAIHPGYGFLSENAAFAQAVLDAGLIWVGPSPESIASMGDKIAAKTIMRAAGVPVLEALAQPTEADLPLLVKASAGGGGRGMRIVRTLADLPGEIDQASAEAASAFGDGTVFVEPYVEPGRHLEVQVVGHRDGVLVLGERDCSVQRRHQKVVEESPAPHLPERTRQALHEAARAAAEAIDYRGAGTVEFLYDQAGDRFFFLEMNTRLQVEHPVTELVHGVDLVELQLTVAEERSIDLRTIGETYGHAIEARLYAEDPDAGYQPQSGLLERFEVPGVSGEFDLLNRPGLRLDAGVESGSVVSTHYDGMLAKLIAWAPSRDQAIRRLADALDKARIHGVTTNRDQLLRVLASDDFDGGRLSTGLLEHLPAAPSRPSRWHLGAYAATVARVAQLAEQRVVQRGVPAGWRNVRSGRAAWHRMTWRLDEHELGEHEVEWVSSGHGIGFPTTDIEVLDSGPGWVRLRDELEFSTWRVELSADGSIADVDSPGVHLRLHEVPRFTDPADAVAGGSLLAPMPGTVVAVAVEQGQAVEAGAPVLVLEAMKMQHTVAAPTGGVVTELNVQPGQQVAAGDVLAVVETEEQQ